MNPDHIVIPHKRVAARVVDGKALILDPQTDGLQRLNDVGSFVWTLVAERQHTPVEIMAAVHHTFEVSKDEADRDVQKFLQALAARELIDYISN